MGGWLLLARKLVRNPILITGQAILPPALSMEVVMAPAMDIEASSNGSINFTLEKAVAGNMAGNVTRGFVNMYGFVTGNYITYNQLQYKSSATITSGAGGTVVAMFSPPVAMGGNVRYDPLPPVSGRYYFWSYVESGTTTFTFVDARGNSVKLGPVMLVDTSSAGLLVYMQPWVQVDFVSSNGYSVVVRLTRSHTWLLWNGGYSPASGTPFDDYMSHGAYGVMTWTGMATGGYADPADPTTVDKVLVTLGRGTWKIGTTGVYKMADGTVYNFTSEYESVIEVV